MRSTRTHVAIVLGYPVERLDEFDDTGLPLNPRFEVLDPHSGAILASHASARAAKRFVVVHELRVIRMKQRRPGRSTDAA